MWRSLTLAVLLALAVAPAATAKDELESLVVCGDRQCRELRGANVRAAASTIVQHLRSRVRKPAPFYEVMMTFRTLDGSREAGSALRYVPSASAVATWRGPSDYQIWFRTDRALTDVLKRATRGLSAQPARELDRPKGAVGPAALSFRSRLLPDAAVGTRPGPEGDDDSPLAYLLSGGLLVAAAALAAVMLRRRRLVL